MSNNKHPMTATDQAHELMKAASPNIFKRFLKTSKEGMCSLHQSHQDCGERIALVLASKAPDILAVAITMAEAHGVAAEEEYQPGNHRKCTKQAPGFERDECGLCRFCLRRKALAAWKGLFPE